MPKTMGSGSPERRHGSAPSPPERRGGIRPWPGGTAGSPWQAELSGPVEALLMSRPAGRPGIIIHSLPPSGPFQTFFSSSKRPVAPSGKAPDAVSTWSSPLPSRQRTVNLCRPAANAGISGGQGADPAANGQSKRQTTQVRGDNGPLSSAATHFPRSTLTSTREMPRAPAQAMPPTGTRRSPDGEVTTSSTATVSMTEVALARASRLQPRSTQ